MQGFQPVFAADDSVFAVIGSVGILLVIMMPFILRILTRHQREMAELMRRTQEEPQVLAEVKELRKQVDDLRHLLLDISLNQPERPSVQARISGQESRPQ